MDRLTGFYFLTNIIWILLQTTVQGRSTYLMVFPEKMRSGETFAIDVNILNSSQPVTVTATMINSENKTVVTNSSVFQQGVQGDLKLDIPSTIPEGRYILGVNGIGGLTFNNKTVINVDNKRLSIFIQTDKAIYKAGQTVKFRVLATKMDLKVIHEDMDIEIFDANGNKIKAWKQVQNASGVYQNELVTHEAPVLGDWKIVVKIMGVEKEQFFTKAEYVLPQFEVTIELDDFALTTDKFLTGKVKSKYTFGKPVTGTIDLEVKPTYSFQWVCGPTSLRRQFNITGEADFAISLKDLETFYAQNDPGFMRPPSSPGPRYSPLNGQSVTLQANVTESLTGRTQNGLSDITFYPTKKTLRFARQDPNNFKPGLPFTLHLETRDHSGKPWNTVGFPQVIKVTITYYLPPNKTATTTTPPTTGNPDITAAMSRPDGIDIIQPFWPPRYVPDEIKTETQRITVGPTGVEEIHLMNIPKETKSIQIEASYNDDVSAGRYLSKANSPSGSFINLKQTSPTTKAGVQSNFVIQSTNIIPKFSYKIVTKGNVVESGQIPSQNTLITNFSLPITKIMAPTARLIVYHTRPDGELVADVLKLDVDGMFQNEVSIDFDKTEALPGDDVSLNINADTGSLVNVLAVDQSVLLLKSGNDITVDKVKSELNTFDDRLSTNWYGPEVFRYKLPFYPSISANSAFENAGLKIFTDAIVPGRYIESFPGSNTGGFPGSDIGGYPGSNTGQVSAGFPGIQQSPTSGIASSNLKPVDRVRSVFPETWLWDQAIVNTSNKVSLRSVVPDTITSWIATAFAVHPTSGLGVAPVASKLKTFKAFFVTLNTPYSVVRGEQVIIQANVFNYLNRDVEVYVSLDYSPDYQNIVFFWSSKEAVYSDKITRTIKIPSGEAASAYFPIIPTTLGYIDLKVTAQSALASDAISKKLLVEAEGLPQEYNVPLTIDLTSSSSFEKTVPITLPQDVVPDSKRVQLSVVGDLIGPSIANIDMLLVMPYGCGEQNMVKFAPNIYITKYLTATDHLTPEIKTKAERFMLKGYQRELTYQRKDGSFSSFGDGDPSGSMWLTAFVVKCFTAGASVIDIDEIVIERAMAWMLDHQAANGTFPEPGLVHNKALQGGSAKGLSLTAYVVIAFLENEPLPMEINERVIKDGNIDRAVNILENNVNSTTDPYQLAVISYALGLAESPRANAAFVKLSALAIVKDSTKHWESTTPVITNWYYSVPPPNAINIETASYALLTVALKPGISEGFEIMKWLISQRNPEGGFSSTQDTVMALQAMSEFGARVYSKDIEVTIDVQGTGGSPFARQFKIGNAPGFTDPSVLITEDVPDNVTSLTISASGKGLCLVEVGVFYNIDTNEFAEPSFQLNTSVTEPKENSFTLNACTRWLLKDASNMAVLEIGIPTGFSADKESIASLPTLKRIEDGDRKIVLYFDKFTASPTCVSVKMERASLTARVKPVAVRVYDYYDKTYQVTVFYGIQGPASPSVCQICGEDCGCYNKGSQGVTK